MKNPCFEAARLRSWSWPVICAVMVASLAACREEKQEESEASVSKVEAFFIPADTSDHTPILVETAEKIVDLLNGDRRVLDHSHSSEHSEVHGWTDAKVKFDTDDDAKNIVEELKALFRQKGFDVMVMTEESSGYDRDSKESAFRSGWHSSVDSIWHPSLNTADRHVASEPSFWRKFDRKRPRNRSSPIEERLEVFAFLKREDLPVSFHFWLHPEEEQSFFSFCMMH